MKIDFITIIEEKHEETQRLKVKKKNQKMIEGNTRNVDKLLLNKLQANITSRNGKRVFEDSNSIIQKRYKQLSEEIPLHVCQDPPSSCIQLDYLIPKLIHYTPIALVYSSNYSWIFRLSIDGTKGFGGHKHHWTLSPLWTNSIQSQYNCYSWIVSSCEENAFDLKKMIIKLKVNEQLEEILLEFKINEKPVAIYIICDWKTLITLLGFSSPGNVHDDSFICWRCMYRKGASKNRGEDAWITYPWYFYKTNLQLHYHTHALLKAVPLEYWRYGPMHMFTNLFSRALGNLILLATKWQCATKMTEIITSEISELDKWSPQSPHMMPCDMKKIIQKKLYLQLLPLIPHETIEIQWRKDQISQEELVQNVFSTLFQSILFYYQVIYEKPENIDYSIYIPLLFEARNDILAVFAYFKWDLHATNHYALNHFLEDIESDYLFTYPIIQVGCEEGAEAGHKTLKIKGRNTYQGLKFNSNSSSQYLTKVMIEKKLFMDP